LNDQIQTRQRIWIVAALSLRRRKAARRTLGYDEGWAWVWARDSGSSGVDFRWLESSVGWEDHCEFATQAGCIQASLWFKLATSNHFTRPTNSPQR